MAARNPKQFVINERRQLLQRVRIAARPFLQQTGDVRQHWATTYYKQRGAVQYTSEASIEKLPAIQVFQVRLRFLDWGPGELHSGRSSEVIYESCQVHFS